MYSFAMICYELFEGSKPFGQMDAMSAARAASLFDRRPSWGKVNRQTRDLSRTLHMTAASCIRSVVRVLQQLALAETPSARDNLPCYSKPACPSVPTPIRHCGHVPTRAW